VTTSAQVRRAALAEERAATRTTVIEPGRRWSLGVRGLFHSRELLYLLVWRDVKIRYKQTFFGASWALIQPILLMGVFGLFFGRLAGLPSDGLPYSIFVLAGLVPWTFFSNGFAASSRSVVASSDLISKIYFPRLLIPVGAAAAFGVDFIFAFAFLVVVEPFWGVYPTWRMVFVPPLAVFALLIALSMGIWLAALNVRFRDVAYTTPFIVQLLLFASPIGYPSTLIPEQLRFLYGLNPIAGLVEAFRWSAADAQIHVAAQLAVSIAVTAVLLVGALVYFGRTERSFADII
jgi:lipopolysaccharide transport system permease protein